MIDNDKLRKNKNRYKRILGISADHNIVYPDEIYERMITEGLDHYSFLDDIDILRESDEKAQTHYTVKCDGCGIYFHHLKFHEHNRMKNSCKKYYCTLQCFEKHRKRAEMVGFDCALCGKNVSLSKKSLNARLKQAKGGKLFCSLSCFHKSYAASLRTWNCAGCGKEFQIQYSRYYYLTKKSKSCKTYCSDGCRHSSRKRRRKRGVLYTGTQ